jgi:putative restriction endonuclease
VKAFVGITDYEWFKTLSAIPGIGEVNFWQPSGETIFRALSPGEPFLFKLHSPRDFVVGGGFFAHSTTLPLNLAWDTFREKNGARSFDEMRRLVEKHRRPSSSRGDYQIGCILLEQPFFFNERDWIRVPSDWKSNIVRGKTYYLYGGLGRNLWEDVQLRLLSRDLTADKGGISDIEERYGSPLIVDPRLGQGSFRIMVTDAYQRRCAITQECTLPALEAVHIKPFGESGPHRVDNGILLRSDIHRLFDTGYVTVSPEYTFEVSRRIREEFENGTDYYKMHGYPLHLPPKEQQWPSRGFIEWHNVNVFRG